MLNDEDKNEVPDIFAGFITETSVDGEITETHGEHNARKDPDWPQFADASDEDEDGDDDEQEEFEDDEDEDLADDDDGDEDDDGDDSELDADASDDDEDREDTKPKRRKKSARQRIAELTAEKHAARDRIAELEAEREALKAQGGDDTDGNDDAADTRPETDIVEADLSDLEKPDPSKYEFGEIDAKYMQDIAEYNAEVAFRKREAKAETERNKKAKADADANAIAQMEKNFLDNVLTPGLEEFDDFETVVIEGGKAGKYRLSPTLVSLISESENGAKIMYHFASNPKEASKVASQSVAKQAAYFGRLEARFDTSADDGEDAGKNRRTKATRAPKPGKRKARGSGKGKGTNPATTDFASFEKMVRSKG